VARGPSGAVTVFPPAVNHHIGGILAWSVIPGGLDSSLAGRATELGRAVGDAISLEGVLAVEMFLVADGALYVNELAPRPHNSFHHTERACVTSQFEQLVRAACDLPLGDVGVMRPTAIANLLGELWQGTSPPPFASALGYPTVELHLYGKRVAKRGRKMGHVSAVGADADEALRLAVMARDALAPADVSPWLGELERQGRGTRD
jgi:5-(carboxyamino)imidazole ribonucleotide synthase